MRRSRKRLTAAVATLALAGGLSAGLASPASAQDASGDATGLQATLDTLLLDLNVPPTPFVSAPPSSSDSIANLNLDPLVNAVVLGVQSTVNGPAVNSAASVVGVNVLPEFGVLSADAITSECSANPDGVAADAGLLNASALGGSVNIPINAPPNTTVALPFVGSLTLNEQTETDGGIVVRSVHLNVNVLNAGLVVADVILSESACFPGDAAAAATATAAVATGGTPNLTG
jgi:hypothetical protein